MIDPKEYSMGQIPFIKNVFSPVNENPGERWWKLEDTRPWNYQIRFGPDNEAFAIKPGETIDLQVVTNGSLQRCVRCGTYHDQDSEVKKGLCDVCYEHDKYGCVLGAVNSKTMTPETCRHTCVHWKDKCSDGHVIYVAGFSCKHMLKIGKTSKDRFFTRAIEAGYGAVIPFLKENGRAFSNLETMRLEQHFSERYPNIFSTMGFPRHGEINPVAGFFSQREVDLTLRSMINPVSDLVEWMQNRTGFVEAECSRVMGCAVKAQDVFIPDYSNSINKKMLTRIIEGRKPITNFSELKAPYKRTMAGARIETIKGKIIAAKYPSLLIEDDDKIIGVTMRKSKFKGKLVLVPEHEELIRSMAKEKMKK